jgi:hypothetical protein
MATIREAVEKIKSVGVENTRITPTTPGKCKIEIKQNNAWVTILEDVNIKSADDIIRQASSRLLLG